MKVLDTVFNLINVVRVARLKWKQGMMNNETMWLAA
jgi:hypothetical protein